MQIQITKDGNVFFRQGLAYEWSKVILRENEDYINDKELYEKFFNRVDLLTTYKFNILERTNYMIVECDNMNVFATVLMFLGTLMVDENRLRE